MSYFAYPREGLRIDPYDTAIDDPQCLYLTNRGISYAFRPGEEGEPMDAGEFETVIPMGYTSLMYTQKLAIAVDGAIVKEWARVVEQADGPSDAEWYRRWGAYRVIVRPSRQLCEDPPVNDLDEARRAVTEASVGTAALLLFVSSAADWH